VVLILNGAEVGVSGAVQAFLMQDTLVLDVDVASVARALVTITVVVTLGALWPAWRAARLSPVIAMGRGG
jgi:ABC-type antimicrobial peptide transport system permease subunit